MDSLFRALSERRKLSYVELNLETWRQLWRVLEMSDIILLIVDIRCPVSLIAQPLFGMTHVFVEKATYCVDDQHRTSLCYVSIL